MTPLAFSGTPFELGATFGAGLSVRFEDGMASNPPAMLWLTSITSAEAVLKIAAVKRLQNDLANQKSEHANRDARDKAKHMQYISDILCNSVRNADQSCFMKGGEWSSTAAFTSQSRRRATPLAAPNCIWSVTKALAWRALKELPCLHDITHYLGVLYGVPGILKPLIPQKNPKPPHGEASAADKCNSSFGTPWAPWSWIFPMNTAMKTKMFSKIYQDEGSSQRSAFCVAIGYPCRPAKGNRLIDLFRHWRLLPQARRANHVRI